jgi:hypothetical protein
MHPVCIFVCVWCFFEHRVYTCINTLFIYSMYIPCTLHTRVEFIATLPLWCFFLSHYFLLPNVKTIMDAPLPPQLPPPDPSTMQVFDNPADDPECYPKVDDFMLALQDPGKLAAVSKKQSAGTNDAPHPYRYCVI